MSSNNNLRILSYESALSHEWDNFVINSRNGTFLHLRSYMDYHKDRFPDSSLMFYCDKTLAAILPATIKNNFLTSHAGLTYGGLIVGKKFHSTDAISIFKIIKYWCQERNLEGLLYKVIPHIYHKMPSEDDLYALHKLGGHLYRRDISTSINLENRYPYTKGRKSAIKSSVANKVMVSISENYQDFMLIESKHLMTKHGIQPTHTATEIKNLAVNFPKNIKLYCAHLDEEMLGGVLVYLTDTTCHAQYIASTEKGKKLGAIDACINQLLSNLSLPIRWFDFGISTTNEGMYLDENLVLNKESWGGRTVVYDHYKWIF